MDLRGPGLLAVAITSGCVRATLAVSNAGRPHVCPAARPSACVALYRHTTLRCAGLHHRKVVLHGEVEVLFAQFQRLMVKVAEIADL